MKILGIDYGKKRLGLALYDTAVRVAVPFGLLAETVDNLYIKISHIIQSENVAQIVVGLPLGLDGKENEATLRVRTFGKELEKTTAIPVDFFDERFTSVAADRSENGISRDEKAAMVILEGWVERNKANLV